MIPDSLLGKQLDEYRLVSLLGHGGMARVYLGLDVRLRRYVAVKVIDTPHRDDTGYAIRFEREAQAIAQLEHPHIVRIYRYGEARGVLYMAMQYVEGADLGAVLSTYRQEAGFEASYIPPEEAGRIIRDVCQALDYAHARQVIHRDIKPSNIMLDRNGRAILTDFGLALMTELGTANRSFGTPHYMAPEQVVSSGSVVPQSDLYAVGVILFEMFTGELPFVARQPMDIALMHVHNPPPAPRAIRPSISPALEAVILRALAKDPQQRYPTGAALTAALDTALRAGPITTPALIPLTASNLTLPQRVTEQVERHPLPPLPADPLARPRPLPLDQPPTPAGPLRRLRPVALAAGCLALFLFLCAVLAWQLFRPEATTPEPTAVISLPPTATTLPATPTVQPTRTHAPTLAATATPQPTATARPISYELLLVRLDNNAGLVVINSGDTRFPLAPLQLAEDERALNGADWDVNGLAEGECTIVLAAGDDNGLSLPGNLTCRPVGDLLRRGGPNRFWRNNFTIFYDNQRLGTCPPEEQICQVIITVSPATP